MLDINFDGTEEISNRKKAQIRGRKIQVVQCVMCNSELILMRKQSENTLCWECQKIRASEQAKYRHTNEEEDPNKIVRIE